MKARTSIFLTTVALLLMMLIAPVYATTSDSDIEDAAKNSYTFRTYLKDDDVKVQVEDGVVTLTGIVADESRKALAGDTVANLPDVKQVDNKLVFKAEPSPDLWLTTKVKTTLLFHHNISAATRVDVKDSVVTLSGEADNQKQKELTGEYAMDIVGVKSVNNQMTVRMTTSESQQSRHRTQADGSVDDKTSGYRLVGNDTTSDQSMGVNTTDDTFDDASITALVKTTLLSHRSTSELLTLVETRDGVVSLSGKAGNDAEKDMATRLAGNVKGVKSVDNKMTLINKTTAN